jgi:hypothetical protein
MRAQRGFGLTALGLAALSLLFGGVGRAQADIITSVSLSGESAFNIVGDTLTLNPGSIPSLTLPPNVPVTANTQTLTFFTGDSDGTNQLFPFTLTENVTIGGVTDTIIQPGQLLITPAADTLTVFPGPTTAFDLPGQGVVFFTPLGAGPVTHTIIGQTTTVQLQGTFEAVPEPSTLTLFCLGAAGLAAWRWRKHRQATA